MAGLKRTVKTELAAQLVAEGQLSEVEIAKEVGVALATIYNWKKLPEFRAMAEEFLSAFRDRIRRKGIAVLERRVQRLDRRWEKLHQVIDERAADPRLRDVPGGTTGLIVHNVKGVGRGDDFQLIDLYEVDTGTLAEIRAHEQQAAKELGQWVNQTDLTSGGKPIPIRLVEVVSPGGDDVDPESESRDETEAGPDAEGTG